MGDDLFQTILAEATSKSASVANKIAVFYSGFKGTVSNQLLARKCAADFGGNAFYTIFDTDAGKYLEGQISFEGQNVSLAFLRGMGLITKSQETEIWEAISANMANQITPGSNVIAFVGGGNVRAVNTFVTTEYTPLLSRAGSINGVSTAKLPSDALQAVQQFLAATSVCYDPNDPNNPPPSASAPITTLPYDDSVTQDAPIPDGGSTLPLIVQDPAGSGAAGVSAATSWNLLEDAGVAVGVGVLAALAAPFVATAATAAGAATTAATILLQFLQSISTSAVQSASNAGEDAFQQQGDQSVANALAITPDIASVLLANAVATGGIPASDLSQLTFAQTDLTDLQTLLANSTQPLAIQVPVSSTSTLDVTVQDMAGGVAELDTSGTNPDGSTFSTVYDGNTQTFGQNKLSINESNGSNTSFITETGVGSSVVTENLTYTAGNISASEAMLVAPSFDSALSRTLDGVTLVVLGPANPADLSFGPNGSIQFANLDTGLTGTDPGETAIAAPDGSISIFHNDGNGSVEPVITFEPGQIAGENLGFGSDDVSTDLQHGVIGLTAYYFDPNNVLHSTEYLAILNGGTATPPGLSINEQFLFSGSGGTLNLSYPTLTEAATSGYTLGILNFQLGDVVDLGDLQAEVDANNATFVNFPTIHFSYGVTVVGGSLIADIIETKSGTVTTTTTVASTAVPLGPYLGFTTNNITIAPDGTGGVDVYSLDLSGATIASALGIVTAAVQVGQTVNLGKVFAASALAMNTLILQGPGIGTLSGLGTVANLEVAAGGNLLLQGGTLLTDPVTIDAGGNISGFGKIIGSETVNGTITAEGGTLDITGYVSGAGALTFNPDGTLFLEGTVAATEGLLFNASNEILTLGTTAVVRASITGFAAGDVIGLAGQQVTSAVYDASQHTLAVTGGGGGLYSLAFTGTYQQSDFEVMNGAVGITCFVSGTRIATKHGELLVEDFAIGDLVRTKFTGLMPVKWIGHRRIDCSRHPDPRKVWPVRVVAGAFGKQLPHHDLWLSPDHAVFEDGVLIPIKRLINGCTITQEPREEVTYFHMELDQHDVLFAEGLPTESYLDTGDRSKFENGGTPLQLHPDFSARIWEAKGCAPLIVTGPILAAVRARLLQRAAKLAGRPRPCTRVIRAA
jgi:hypothetical protein